MFLFLGLLMGGDEDGNFVLGGGVMVGMYDLLLFVESIFEEVVLVSFKVCLFKCFLDVVVSE